MGDELRANCWFCLDTYLGFIMNLGLLPGWTSLKRQRAEKEVYFSLSSFALQNSNVRIFFTTVDNVLMDATDFLLEDLLGISMDTDQAT